jgi:dipeptidyl aminopeptidase/acylaminoacyl peptidase
LILFVIGASREAAPAGGAFSGSEGSLVFTSFGRSQGGDLWLVRDDGSGLTRLTAVRRPAFGPAWSPDGRRIAYFAQERSEDFEVYVLNATSRAVRQVTHNSVRDEDPSWSPDGSRFVFAGSGTGLSDLYVMNANGGRRLNLTRSELTEYQPAWSPDGKTIAFQACRGVARRSTGCALYAMRSDGRGAVRRLASPGAYPAWSPDGAKIAFSQNYVPTIINADGTGEAAVRTEVELSDRPGGPAWSPTGDMLALGVEVAEECHQVDVSATLALASVNGASQSLLFGCELSNDFDPDWQPVCTLYGTDRDDVLLGTPGDDVICALRGNDRVAASAGNDVIIGGDGNDVIFGGPGKDRLFGSAGRDKLFAKDGEVEDVTNGGPGRDVAMVDGPDDRPWELERTIR